MIGVLSDISAVFSGWRIWFLMGNQDIAIRYRRSMIGPFWISLTMGATVLGLAILFSQIFVMDLANYLTWLGVSLMFWSLLSAMVSEGCQIAIEADLQLRSLPLPLPVLAARMVHRNSVIFLHNAVVIAVLLAVFGYRPSVELVYALAGLAVLLLIGFFGAIALAPVCLRFRDVPQIVNNILQLLFFFTPIMWLPTQGRVNPMIVQANPFHHMLEIVRAPILGAAPPVLSWIVTLAVLGGIMLIALLVLGATRRRIFVWL